MFSRVQLFVTPWTVTHQAPLSMGFSRQESWSGLPFPSPGDLPDPGIEPMSPALLGDFLLPLSLLGGPPSSESVFREKRWTGAASMQWTQCSDEIPACYGREGGAAAGCGPQEWARHRLASSTTTVIDGPAAVVSLQFYNEDALVICNKAENTKCLSPGIQ